MNKQVVYTQLPQSGRFSALHNPNQIQSNASVAIAVEPNYFLRRHHPFPPSANIPTTYDIFLVKGSKINFDQNLSNYNFINLNLTKPISSDHLPVKLEVISDEKKDVLSFDFPPVIFPVNEHIVSDKRITLESDIHIGQVMLNFPPTRPVGAGIREFMVSSQPGIGENGKLIVSYRQIPVFE